MNRENELMSHCTCWSWTK